MLATVGDALFEGLVVCAEGAAVAAGTSCLTVEEFLACDGLGGELSVALGEAVGFGGRGERRKEGPQLLTHLRGGPFRNDACETRVAEGSGVVHVCAPAKRSGSLQPHHGTRQLPGLEWTCTPDLSVATTVVVAAVAAEVLAVVIARPNVVKVSSGDGCGAGVGPRGGRRDHCTVDQLVDLHGQG